MGQLVYFLFAGTVYVFEDEFPADTFLICALEIPFSTSVGSQGFQKDIGKQQLFKLLQLLPINFPLLALSCLMAHALKC